MGCHEYMDDDDDDDDVYLPQHGWGSGTSIWAKARFPLREFTGLVNLGAFFDTRQLGPSTRVSKNAPEFTGRQLGPWTRVVETGLKWVGEWVTD